MFEYLYYRLYHYFEKCYMFFKGDNYEWIDEDCKHSSNLAFSAWEFMLVYCIAMTLRIFLPLEFLFHNFVFAFLLIFGSGTVFLIYNKKHFKNKMPELDEKFKDARINKWLKTWLFAILFFLSIFIFILFPFFFSHLLRWILGG